MINFEVNKTYKAIITGFSDSTDGKYKVFIPALMSSDSDYNHIEAKNRASNYGKWINPKTNEVESIGTYIPLQLGMQVEVVFENRSFLSAKIVNFWFDDIPLDKSDQESFYMLAKTKNGTMVYTDDKRNITQILHSGGKTSFLMMDDKVSVSVNEVSTVSNNNLCAFEMTQEGFTFKVGNNVMQLDETGFHLKVGDNVLNLTKKDTTLKTDNLAVDINSNLEVKANNIFMTALEESNYKSTAMRISGGQNVSLTGNVLNIASNMNTTLSSNMSINLRSLVSIQSESSMITNKALGLLYNYGASACYDGITTVLNGVTTALNGTTIFEDSQIIRGIGAGAAMAATMSGMSMATSLALKASDIALVTGFHFNDPFSGMTCNVLSETIPGVAQGCPNQMPIVSMVPSMDYINSTIKYINKGVSSGNIGTVDYVSGLSGITFKSVYIPENKV